MKQVIKEEGARPIKIWTDEIEDTALQQAKNLARLPFIHHNGVALMPDVHAGIGSTVGSVIATEKAVIPAAVGVDIGCVDAETEYLSPAGWKKISEYDGGQVMQYNKDSGVATFVTPSAYIRKPATEFYEMKSKYGVNQRLSPDHRVLYRGTTRGKKVADLYVKTAQEIKAKHDENVSGFGGKFLTTFVAEISTRIPLSDVELRVMAMVCADGAFDSRKDTNRCVLQFTKDRKLERAETLLSIAEIEFRRDDITDERGLVYRLIFDAPIREKSLGAFWGADASQIEVIAMEAMKWDAWDNKVYYTRDKASADFMQFALSACGYRAVLREDKKGSAVDYRVFANTNTEVGIKSNPKTPIKVIDAKGQEQFCFAVPSSFWVMRRGGNVTITGNCGMNAVRLSLKASDMPESMKAIRDQIERDVPLGTGGAHKREDMRHKVPEHLTSLPDSVVKATGGDAVKAMNKAFPQLGTLGSGNHFIEICIDENEDVWIMLHSGSRGIGNIIGRHFIEKAKRDMEKWYVSLPDQDLAYLPEDSENFDDYMNAVQWAQDYALQNRALMMNRVIEALKRHITKPFTITQEAINCHHNYVEKENHFGKNVWITRKGAIRARVGDLGIIPGSMGQRSYIVRGKGDAASYCSCSHGAGRVMSRTEARKRFTLDDLKKQTEGVECRKDDAVLDEIPGAYKSIDTVMENQKDLVEVVHVLKQILCVKGA